MVEASIQVGKYQEKGSLIFDDVRNVYAKAYPLSAARTAEAAGAGTVAGPGPTVAELA